MNREVHLPKLIVRLSSLRYQFPAFAPGLEQKFAAEADRFRRRRQWLEGVVAIVLYVAAAAAVQRLAPHPAASVALLRFGLVLPVVALVNLSMWLRLPPWLHDTLIVAGACVAGSVELVAHWEGVGSVAQLAVVGVLIFTNTVMRVCLPYAVAALAWAAVAEGLLLRTLGGSVLRVEGLEAAMVLALGFLTLVANYSQDREARLAFLRTAQKAELAGALAQSNEQLAKTALSDSLTGLANRSALDLHLKRVWTEAPLASTPCCMVMVDIDHFKSLNDRYGHLYGDRVIKRVAHLLAEALRRDDDFIARYGGEEFVVVLPGTPLTMGLRVAERLRALVELAGLPSLRSGDGELQGRRATISVGVSEGVPRLTADAYALIGSADEALYRAKRDGRNAVRSSRDISDGVAGPVKLRTVEPGGAREVSSFGGENRNAGVGWSEAALKESSRVA